MIKPLIPANESERLRALNCYSLLDSLPEKDFDDITKLASQICDTPISTITLIDANRQWFKAHHGLTSTETPRNLSFCAHAINTPDEILVVPDSRLDERFSDNPLVIGEPMVVFYAGVPLVSEDGYALGSLCIIDNKPRIITNEQYSALKILSNQVIRLFELRKKNQELAKKQSELEQTLNLFEQTGKIANVGGWKFDIFKNKMNWSLITKKIHEVPEDYEPDLNTGIEFYKEGESRERIIKLVNEAVETGKGFDTELQIITAKGNERWVRAKGEAVFKNGKCEQLFGVFQDIHEKKLTEQRLEKTLDLIEETSKVARVGGWEYNLLNDKIAWTAVTKEIHEVPEDYLPKIEDAVEFYKQGTSRDAMIKFIQESKESGNGYDAELQIVTAKGNERWVRIKGKAEFVNGECVRLHGILQDIQSEKLKDILLDEKNKALEKSNELFEQTSKVSKVGGWNVDFVNNLITWTTVTKEIHEFEDDYNLNLQSGILFYKEGEDREKIIMLVNQALKEETEYDVELRIVTAKGKEKWVRNKGKSVFKNGKCIRLYGIIQDIHAEKLKDIQLTQSEKLFRLTLENAPIGLALLDKNGKWLKVNKALCNILGYTEEELFAIDYRKITHKDDLIEEDKYIRALLSNEIESYQLEKRYKHKRGQYIWVLRSVSLVKDFNGAPSYFISHTIDITQKRKDEQVIKEERKLLLTLINNIPVNVFIKDTDSRKTLVNKREIEYSGFKNERDILGKTDYELYPEESAVISVNEDQEIFSSGVPMLNKETCSIKQDGAKTWFLTSKIPLKNEENKITGLLGISYDINERKKLEERQKSLLDVTTEQNTRLVNFAHIVSHNLRSISSNFAMLINEYKNENNEDDKQMIFELLQKSSDNLSETVSNLNEIVDINNKINENFSLVNLHTEIEKVKHNVQSLLKKGEIDFINDVPEDINLNVVPAYLNSIILNFITNSIKYKSPNKQAYIKFRASEEEQAVIFSAEDNGKGIDLKKYGEKLFGMYKTFHGNKDAKGVGLFITKNQIEAMGGTIEVESEVGEGTTFKIRLNQN